MNLKNISDKRISMLNNNPDDLKNIIIKNNPELEVINNKDRTIYINGYTDINDIIVIFNKDIIEFIGEDSKINPLMLYDIFPLNKNSCLIKI